MAIRAITQNALAIANFPATTQTVLGNQSWTDSYGSMINGIATTGATANSNVTSTQDIVQALQTQQQNVSGVSLDQETVNMLQQQRSYQGAAMFISTVNQMMQSLLNITLLGSIVMSVLPVGISRVSNLMQSNVLTDQIDSTQTQLLAGGK